MLNLDLIAKSLRRYWLWLNSSWDGEWEKTGLGVHECTDLAHPETSWWQIFAAQQQTQDDSDRRSDWH